MIARLLPSSLLKTAALFIAASMSSVPALAAPAPQARLVHCGGRTCLRLSGYRSQSALSVPVGGQDLVVEGDRAWRVTVPLATARGWATSRDYSLTVTLVDPDTGSESTQPVLLPPGALGPRMELAALVVRAR